MNFAKLGRRGWENMEDRPQDSRNMQTMGKAQPLHSLPGLRKHPSSGANLLQVLLFTKAQRSPEVSWTFYAQRNGDITIPNSFHVCRPMEPTDLHLVFYFISITALRGNTIFRY